MASTSAAESAIAAPETPAHVKPRELADPLNHYLYHPLANRLALILRPTGIAPNTVSLISGMVVMAATLAYIGLDRPPQGLPARAAGAPGHRTSRPDHQLPRRQRPVRVRERGRCGRMCGHHPARRRRTRAGRAAARADLLPDRDQSGRHPRRGSRRLRRRGASRFAISSASQSKDWIVTRSCMLLS